MEKEDDGMSNFINLEHFNLIDTKSTSSKGNQQKWLVNNNWYKADYMGYEALSEVVISKLLERSNVENFVKYNITKIQFDNKIFTGCYSENFKKKDDNIITLERLSKSWLANSMAKEIVKYSDTKDRIKFTVDFIEKVTGLNDVGKYITTMLELDAFFLNEDRHTNNIAFILNDKTNSYSFCPFYDFGLSLLSDTMSDYPLDIDIYNAMNKIKAKPFSTNFDEQLDAAQELYGNYLHFSFTGKDIENVVDDLVEYYSKEILTRVKDILYYRKHKYTYMFS